MVALTERDVLELLCFAESSRRPLEILGYEYSSRGARRFRSERPDFLPSVCQIIRASLEQAGTFPRAPSAALREDGPYLERRPDGGVSLVTSFEVGISQTERVRIEFASMQDAILGLLRRVSDPAYLTVPAEGRNP